MFYPVEYVWLEFQLIWVFSDNAEKKCRLPKWNNNYIIWKRATANGHKKILGILCTNMDWMQINRGWNDAWMHITARR